eukprot:97988_1
MERLSLKIPRQRKFGKRRPSAQFVQPEDGAAELIGKLPKKAFRIRRASTDGYTASTMHQIVNVLETEITAIMKADCTRLMLLENGKFSREGEMTPIAGIAGEVYRTGEIMNIIDPRANKFFDRKVDRAPNKKTEPDFLMTFPFFADQKEEKNTYIVAVLQVFASKPRLFTPQDESKMKLIENVVAHPLRHAQLLHTSDTLVRDSRKV